MSESARLSVRGPARFPFRRHLIAGLLLIPLLRQRREAQNLKSALEGAVSGSPGVKLSEYHRRESSGGVRRYSISRTHGPRGPLPSLLPHARVKLWFCTCSSLAQLLYYYRNKKLTKIIRSVAEGVARVRQGLWLLPPQVWFTGVVLPGPAGAT